ncbi:predicted protein [Pyrenophora tritici-repentis Pt-1C-BFP]|uniref:Uncharacterized protein n=1 Tax=Pyrenophora tritici-repentis (strain Pt-1C-BFP) TaxID=426418 RepID=B2WJC9_PYRTR|nr:uncharacterized protein PTRG_10088 [Pyrenophora tritici-repentis Pt-1C-BFP]EDU43139.1 predicted protein [Pyrenophora tritici-repentis Pt-1C-BFP]
MGVDAPTSQGSAAFDECKMALGSQPGRKEQETEELGRLYRDLLVPRCRRCINSKVVSGSTRAGKEGGWLRERPGEACGEVELRAKIKVEEVWRPRRWSLLIRRNLCDQKVWQPRHAQDASLVSGFQAPNGVP